MSLTAFVLLGVALVAGVAGAVAPSALAKPGGRLPPAAWQVIWSIGYPIAVLAGIVGVACQCGGAP